MDKKTILASVLAKITGNTQTVEPTATTIDERLAIAEQEIAKLTAQNRNEVTALENFNANVTDLSAVMNALIDENKELKAKIAEIETLTASTHIPKVEGDATNRQSQNLTMQDAMSQKMKEINDRNKK